MMNRLRDATLRDERTVPRFARLIVRRALEEPRDGR